MCNFNVQSLRNKSASFVDFVYDSKADLVAVIETWLTDNDTANAALATPVGYKLGFQARQGRTGGGTALLYRENLNIHKIVGGEKSSFEYSEWTVSHGRSSKKLRLYIIYRPPYSVNHPVLINEFISEFSDFF